MPPTEAAVELVRRRDRELVEVETSLTAAVGAAVRQFLRRLLDEADVSRLGLTAATPPSFVQSTALFGLGAAQGWWAASVDDHVRAEVLRAWTRGFYATRDGELLFSSLQAADDYLAHVRDRLVYQAAGPTLPERAFEVARVSISDELARGSSSSTVAARLAADFGWDVDATFWRGRYDELTVSLDSLLDPVGPPGSAERLAAQHSDSAVARLQALRSEAALHIDRVKSEWEVRAERIARTEATGAYNAGTLEALHVEGAGVKVWLATGDSRTRDSHLLAHLQCVPLTDRFDVGGEAMVMPGDPSGPAGEVINCRCSMVGANDCDQAETLYGFAGDIVDEELAERDLVAASGQAFHDGPGPHSGTGSPQQAHGGGGGGGWQFTGGVTNARVREQAGRGMERVGSRFPSLVEGVTVEVGPESYARNHPGSIGWTRTDQGDVVSLSPRWVDDPDKAVWATDHAGKSGTLVKVPAEAQGFDRVVVHEMSHIAEHRIGEPRLMGAVNDAMVRDHGMTVEQLIADSLADSPGPLSREAFMDWSTYGMSDPHEFVAEAFTDGILNETPSKFGATVIGVFDQLLGTP